MKRRTFVKTSAAVAGLMASMEMVPLRTSAENKPLESGSFPEDNRPAEYLERVQSGPFLPKPSLPGRSYPVAPMSLEERIKDKRVPQRGFCSSSPGENAREALLSGNGAMKIEVMGEPYSEKILFHHENLLMPWKKPVEAPKVADIFKEMRQLILDGKNKEAITLALEKMSESPVKSDTEPHLTIPAFLMNLEQPKTASASNYLRTVNFENGEIRVLWSDENGEWVRQAFVSRPDNVVVQKLTAPEGKTINARISLEKSAGWSVVSGMDWGSKRGIGTTDPDMKAFVALTAEQEKFAPNGVEANQVRQEANGQWITYKCRLDPSVDNSGYAGVTRVVTEGGAARVQSGALIISDAASVLLLTRIEYFEDYSDDKVETLRKDLEGIESDYPVLLDRHQKIHAEMLNRVSVDFGGAAQYGWSIEELLSDQRSRPDFSPALLEKVFEMSRYWFIVNSGKYPPIAAGINSTINLLTAGAVLGGLHEGMEAYFKWMEEIVPDCRTNASNIFGCRGTSYPLFPDKGIGAGFYYTSGAEIGIWPYWISAGGWLLRPYWEHYLATGDLDFLRNRLVPAYKELALFYEDFLTVTDGDGNYIFVPSISPENTPQGNTPGPRWVNASMDIAVCRDVLTNLISACETLGIEPEGVSKWNAILEKLPPYLVEIDGTLKEWAWPTLLERYNHRHLSHLYGVWPGDEIDPDRVPQLAHSAEIANRKRTFDIMATAVAGETLAAYTRCHRALVGARLKDNIVVGTQLRQLIEQGYISSALRCSREPYGTLIPDAHGAIPAIMMEMLAYSRPGVVELLPALPLSLLKGSISGMLARTFARIDKFSWDMETRTADLKITSLKKQDITLLCRYGIEDISASEGVVGAFKKGQADCELHLPENEPVELHLQLGWNNPIDWVAQVD